MQSCTVFNVYMLNIVVSAHLSFGWPSLRAADEWGCPVKKKKKKKSLSLLIAYFLNILMVNHDAVGMNFAFMHL